MVGEEGQAGDVVECDEVASCLLQTVRGRGLVAGPSLQRGHDQQGPRPGAEAEGDQAQLAPLPQHPPCPVVLAGVEQDQAEVAQRAPASWSVLHLLEQQERLPQQPIGLSKVPRGRGDQALVDQRETDPAPVTQTAPDLQAAAEQLAGLGQLSGEAVQVGKMAQGQPLAVEVTLALEGAEAL